MTTASPDPDGDLPSGSPSSPASQSHQSLQSIKKTSGSRLLELDSLRGIAAFSVVLFHYTSHYHSLYGHEASFHPRFPAGKYGVYLFFMISGFVILMTLEKRRGWKDFVVSRISRLYPAYWAAMIVTFAVVTMFGLPDWPVGPHAFLINLTMAQQWLKTPHVDGVYWTLSLELSFYAIMLALSLAGLLARLKTVALIWMAAQIAAFAVMASGRHVPTLVQVSFLLLYAHLFLAGMMFYRWKTTGFTPALGMTLALTLAMHVLIGEAGSMVPTLLSYAVFLLFTWDRLAFLRVRPMLFLGTISYSLYLLHANIGYVIISRGYALGISPYVSVAVSMAVALLLATALTKWVEKPVLAALRKHWQDGRNPGAAAAADPGPG